VHDGGATHGEIETTGGLQDDIAEGLSIEALAIRAPKKAILTIDGCGFFVGT
jgi:hypothetical protein